MSRSTTVASYHQQLEQQPERAGGIYRKRVDPGHIDRPSDCCDQSCRLRRSSCCAVQLEGFGHVKKTALPLFLVRAKKPTQMPSSSSEILFRSTFGIGFLRLATPAICGQFSGYRSAVQCRVPAVVASRHLATCQLIASKERTPSLTQGLPSVPCQGCVILFSCRGAIFDQLFSTPPSPLPNPASSPQPLVFAMPSPVG